MFIPFTEIASSASALGGPLLAMTLSMQVHSSVARPQRLASSACVAGGAQLGIMFYYTYVLQSLKDNKHYIGFTDDLKRRKIEHDSGLVSSTINRRPLKLVYYEACKDKRKAIHREMYFKTGFGRRFLNNRI